MFCSRDVFDWILLFAIHQLPGVFSVCGCALFCVQDLFGSLVSSLPFMFNIYLNVLHLKIEFEQVNQVKRMFEFAGYITLAGDQH